MMASGAHVIHVMPILRSDIDWNRMAIVVRKASQQDSDLLASLNADVQAIHAAALPRRFKPPGPDTFPPSAVAALLARPENLIFIAEIDGIAAGYAYAEIVRR